MKVRVLGASSKETSFVELDGDHVELLVALSDYEEPGREASSATPTNGGGTATSPFKVSVTLNPLLPWRRSSTRSTPTSALLTQETRRESNTRYLKVMAPLERSMVVRSFRVEVAWANNSGSTELLLLRRTNVFWAGIVGWCAVVCWGLAMLLLLPAWKVSGLEGPLVRIFGGVAAGGALTVVSRVFASSQLPRWGLFHRLRIALPALVLSLAVVVVPSLLFVRVWNDTALELELQAPTAEMVLPPKSETLLWKNTFSSFEPDFNLRYGQQICKNLLSDESQASHRTLSKKDDALTLCGEKNLTGQTVSANALVDWLESRLGYTRWVSLGCKDAFSVVPEEVDGRWSGGSRRIQLLQDDCKPIEGAAVRVVDVRWLRGRFEETIRGTVTVRLPFSSSLDSFGPVYAPNFRDGGLLIWQSGVADPTLPSELAVSLDGAGSIPIPRKGNPTWKLMDSGRRYERGTLRILTIGKELRHISVDHALLTGAEVCCPGSDGLSSSICGGDALASDYVGAAGARDAWVVVPDADCHVHVHLAPDPAATKLSLTAQCDEQTARAPTADAAGPLKDVTGSLDAFFCKPGGGSCDRCGVSHLVAHLPEGIASFPRLEQQGSGLSKVTTNVVHLSRKEVPGGASGLWLKLVTPDPPHESIWEHTILTDVVWESLSTHSMWDGSNIVNPPTTIPPATTSSQQHGVSFRSYTDRFGSPCKSAPTRCDGGKTQCDC